MSRTYMVLFLGCGVIQGSCPLHGLAELLDDGVIDDEVPIRLGHDRLEGLK
ncbi:MAG TPA: hypothetical protein GX506_09020, partial [Firmicutes bacterium]|nr:hypothetical protein [Bacillota bacterium]